MPKRENTNTAPILPFDYPHEEGVSIWPCTDCYPWHLDVFKDPESGEPWVREWHAVGCSFWEDPKDA